MSVTGYTPPAADTPSTSSGSVNPEVPALKAPCLAVGSCASSRMESTSSAQLLHHLVTGTPATPSEGGPEAAHVDSPRVSSAASEDSSGHSQVSRRGGGDAGRPQPQVLADCPAATDTLLTRGAALNPRSPSTRGELLPSVVQTVPTLSQGEV